MKKIASILIGITMLFSTCTVCFAEEIYVGRDEDGSDFYFLPHSIEILSKEKNKFIYTVMVKEILGNVAKKKLSYSRYASDICYPNSPSYATQLAVKYRYKMTIKNDDVKIECRQEAYMIFDSNQNLLGFDGQTKYYHDCYSPLMTYEVFAKACQYIFDNF